MTKSELREHNNILKALSPRGQEMVLRLAESTLRWELGCDEPPDQAGPMPKGLWLVVNDGKRRATP